jgi:AAA family ATP:ADP antiporter
MLFTVMDKESKYKAKNVIDTVVYRGGDVVTAWFFKGLGMLGLALAGTAVVGAVVAALWAATGLWLGRAFARGDGADTKRPQPAPITSA